MKEAQAILHYQTYRKDPILAYLLWLFLGLFGAHRFFMGFVSSAIGMILTLVASSGLAMVTGWDALRAAIVIWWIADAFLIPRWIREHNELVMSQAIDGRPDPVGNSLRKPRAVVSGKVTPAPKVKRVVSPEGVPKVKLRSDPSRQDEN